MKHRFIHHLPGNDRLILIFAGWATDAATYADVYIDGWDTLVCYDYSDGLTFDTDILNPYTSIYLYAWSLGVYAASVAMRHKHVTAAFAINGTRTPVDNITGIPVNIYEGTMGNLSLASLEKFRRRMFSGKDAYEASCHLLPTYNSVETLHKELQVIETSYINESSDEGNFSSHGKRKDPIGRFQWTRAYISLEDRIFPPEAQKMAWDKCTQIVTLPEQSHFYPLERIVRSTVPDTSRVGAHFRKASRTYDENAFAQRHIAARLSRLLGDMNPKRRGMTLEIGAGTGIFTRMYGPILVPAESDFIDLYSLRKFGIAPKESYYIADGEASLHYASRIWDVILTTSTMQWFINPWQFFEDVYEHLPKGGLFVASTFLPGNLGELDELRPSPIVYREKWELKKALESLFDYVELEEDEIHVNFPTAREALIHFKHTGVNGIEGPQLSLSSILKAIPINKKGQYYLTYRPLYIIARK